MNKNALQLNMAVIFFWMSMYAYVSTLPLYAASLGADTVTLGIVSGIYGVAPLILRIPIGMLSDRLGKPKAMLLAGGAVLAVSAAAFVFLPGLSWLIFARGAAGAAGAWWVVLTATYGSYFNDEGQVKAQGQVNLSCNIGRLSVAILGGLAASIFGLRAPFIISLAAAAIFLLLIAGMKKEGGAEREKRTFRQLLPAFRNRDLWLFCVLGIFSQFTCFAAPLLFTVVAAEGMGADSFTLGMLNFAFFSAVAAGSTFVGSRLHRKLGILRMLAAAFLIGAVSCIPALYKCGMPVLFAGQVFAGMSYGIVGPTLQGMILSSVPSRLGGVSMGIFQSVYAIGILAGPVLAGLVMGAFSFDASYWMMVLIMTVCGGICLLCIPKQYAHG